MATPFQQKTCNQVSMIQFQYIELIRISHLKKEMYVPSYPTASNEWSKFKH